MTWSSTSVHELSWLFIALMATVPTPIGMLAALPIWRKGEMILGNLAGTTVIFAAAFGFIMKESFELNRLTQACLDEGYTCWPNPAAFTRFAIYAFIALIEVFALFMISLKVEERIRSRRYAPEWR